MRVAYLELYNEEVRDLLSKNPQKQLEVRERVDIGVYVKDLSSFVVKNADEMDKLMLAGNKNSECMIQRNLSKSTPKCMGPERASVPFLVFFLRVFFSERRVSMHGLYNIIIPYSLCLI